jgi:Protein of unknown function (DUF3822)
LSLDPKIIEYSNPEFDAEFARQCRLDLIAGIDGLSALVTDARGTPVGIELWHFENTRRRTHEPALQTGRLFVDNPRFEWPYALVQVAFFNTYATLVPRRLFDSQYLEAYFKLLLRPDQALSFHFEPVAEFDSYLVYAVDRTMKAQIDLHLPKARLTHLAVPQLRRFRALAAQRSDYSVMANLRNQAVQIAVFEGPGLQYYNTFQFEKPEDLLYYLLLAYEQFRLDPLKTPLYLSGHFKEDADTYRLLKRYVTGIVPIPVSGVSLPAGLNGIPEHYLTDLFSLTAA